MLRSESGQRQPPGGPRVILGRSVLTQEHPPIEATELADSIAQLIHDKQGEDIVILDVSGPLVIADRFVIATARNSRHARALASSVDVAMKQSGRLRRNAAGFEGDSPWILLDYDEVVVHVFEPQAREFYDLEDLWGDVPRVAWTPNESAVPPERAPADWESFPDSTGTL